MIRLARFGARKQPYYRVVVIEKERARNGRSVEVVGTYNPRTNPASVDLKRERIDYWTSQGAQLSDRVAKLMAKQPAPAAAYSRQCFTPGIPLPHPFDRYLRAGNVTYFPVTERWIPLFSALRY